MCWKTTTMMLTFLVTMYYFEQSAGNQKMYYKHILVGSPETMRDPHNRLYSFIMYTNKMKNDICDKMKQSYSTEEYTMRRYSPLSNNIKTSTFTGRDTSSVRYYKLMTTNSNRYYSTSKYLVMKIYEMMTMNTQRLIKNHY
ncbi:hypothetical protein CLIB1423_58S00100 (mitochondrion) [[Candida] railenensis]|uniref:hypothetical protein n=1 Tax=[Candida] railenensis TaxID=45579 RepID=UPI0020294A62|nr:hypothetical protein NDB39_mgp01 [[Candida] railenensis]CAH2356102.1 hypothetical protein CLIB1423_58S00100 [[Candida] railenensis]